MSATGDRPEPRSIELTDPRALRALAHPTRLALLALLRADGPQTATSAADRIGESSGSCSFHLRQLARYGLVEPAPGGTGRQKPWRATADYTSWSSVAGNDETAAAADLLSSAVVDQQVEELREWVGRRRTEPDDWQQAAEFSDALLHLTADELAELNRRTWVLAMEFDARRADGSSRPPGTRPVRWFQFAFPQAASGDAG